MAHRVEKTEKVAYRRLCSCSSSRINNKRYHGNVKEKGGKLETSSNTRVQIYSKNFQISELADLVLFFPFTQPHVHLTVRNYYEYKHTHSTVLSSSIPVTRIP